jgi:hypothetical protein
MPEPLQARSAALQATRGASRSGAAASSEEWRDTVLPSSSADGSGNVQAAAAGSLLPVTASQPSSTDPTYSSPSRLLAGGTASSYAADTAVAAAAVSVGRRRGFRFFDDLDGCGTLARELEDVVTAEVSGEDLRGK